MKNYMIRQGDVLVQQIKELPNQIKKQEKCVLALGEVSNHAHKIESGATLYTDPEGRKFLQVHGESAVLTHEEHGPITLPGPAIYRVTIQQEYSWQEGFRNVAD